MCVDGEVATWLVDSSTQFCGRAALFEVLGPAVRGVRARGFDVRNAEAFEQVAVRLELAPALAQAARERDTVVAIGSESEVSPAILEALGQASGEKVYLFPIVIEERTVAILYTVAGIGREVETAALELLTNWAGGAAQLLAPEETARQVARNSGEPEGAPGELVAIAGVNMRAHASAPVLDLKHESLEARARWFARVEVARMRLFHREALERGRAERNIYSALREQIDAARLAYRQDFVAVSGGIADYLDKELTGLANDDANILGRSIRGVWFSFLIALGLVPALSRPLLAQSSAAHLARGIQAFDNRKYSEAIEELKAAQGSKLADYTAFYLASARIELRDFEQARKDLAMFHKLPAPSPMETKALLLEAKALAGTGAGGEAAKMLMARYDELPQPSTDFTLAQVYEAAGEPAQAAKYYERANYLYPLSDSGIRAEKSLEALKALLGSAYPLPTPAMMLERGDRYLAARVYAKARVEFTVLREELTGKDREMASVQLANRLSG